MKKPPSYHGHPVFGTIDKNANYIHIFIDRNNNNPDGEEYGIEEFVGRFIKSTDYPGSYPNPPCAPDNWKKEMNHMMLLRSVKTGRQLVLYQQETN